MHVGLIFKDSLCRGGYPRDIRWLASTLSEQGVSVTLLGKLGKSERDTEGLINSVHIESMEHVDRIQVNLYHLFGIFIPEHLWTLRKLLSRPLVISPMGHLMPYHLQQKKIKKRLYIQAIRSFLRKVRWFHVFSDIERKSLDQYLGNETQIFEAGLGVFPVPVIVPEEKRDKVKDTSCVDLLFLGRNDIYQKGIDILLQGFASSLRQGANIMLTIAGKPWGNSQQYIREFIQKEGLGERVRVLGPVDEEAKWKLLTKAHYLVFLSRWDGPPRPIREAIAVGTPVIVSPETNMGGMVLKYKAGMEVRLEPEEVAQAIFSVSDDRSKWAEHYIGVQKLRERLAWSCVAEDYLRGYELVLESWK